MPLHSLPRPRYQAIAQVLLGTLVIATLTTLSRAASFSDGALSLFWPASGVGFALLCTQGGRAAWSIALGVGVWASLAFSGAPATIPWAMLASVAGPWVVWRRLQARFASTSQPFARQATTLAFLRLQALLGAPLSALLGTLGLLVTGQLPWGPQALAALGAYWVVELCGTLLFAPLAWELLVARARGGWPRLRSKLQEALQFNPRFLSGLALLSLGLGLLLASTQVDAARALLSLLLPLLLWSALREPPLTVHVLCLLSGISVLTASAWGAHAGLDHTAATDLELLISSFFVLVTVASTQLLLVTAHERRLALRRLERQADTDPLTNLLSLSGLYRRLEELGDRGPQALEADSRLNTDSPESMLTAEPHAALISVRMSNGESMEQLLGVHRSDLLERTSGGALTSAAPKVVWARISKAHFVGLHEGSRAQLDQLLMRVSFAVIESGTLLDESVGRPQWSLAAVTLNTTPLPPAEVIMACLRRAEQTAQDSRQIQISAVNQASAQALKEEAEQAERIREVITAQQLWLFAQPIVSNTSPADLPHKYEVLVRLREADGSIISPGVFLPVAMRAGLMQALDMAVMEQTFAWFAAHPQALQALNHCAINLSGPTVASPVVAQRIAQGLAQHQLPADKFTFEITESQAIANPAQATDTIKAIRACGCRVAIDDFGTGVATFDYLKRFDVDYIKIDGAFIKNLLNDPVDRVIVESIVKVAHQMKVRTVAEFVSSTELHGAVVQLGVDESQGYAFGAPRPLGEWFGEAD